MVHCVDIDCKGDLRKLDSLGKADVLLVAFSKFGLGHVSRCTKIAIRLAERGLNCMIVSSQNELYRSWSADGITAVALPKYHYYGSEIPVELPSKDVGGSGGALKFHEMQAIRSDLLKNIARKVMPSVVYIDAYPFHPDKAQGECGGLLEYLEMESPSTICISGFRGELSRPLCEHTDREIYRLLKQYINHLFVFVDPCERNILESQYRFLKQFHHSVTYAGYVVPLEINSHTLSENQSIHWIASVGGGIDGFHILESICRAKEMLWLDGVRPKLAIATGERMPKALYEKLIDEYSGKYGISIYRMIPNYFQALARSELVFCMAGYNTCTELFGVSANVIAFPRCSERNQEQWVRALKFKQYGVIDEVVEASRMTPDGIVEAVLSCQRKNRSSNLYISKLGAENCARYILDTLLISDCDLHEFIN